MREEIRKQIAEFAVTHMRKPNTVFVNQVGYAKILNQLTEEQKEPIAFASRFHDLRVIQTREDEEAKVALI